MTLYDQVEQTPNGGRRLAAARLRYRALGALHKAMEASGMKQSGLAERLGVRKSAVNQVVRGDGNVRINTLAEYLFELGYELDIRLVPAGEPRRARMEGRAVTPAFTENVADAPSSDVRVAVAMAFLQEASLVCALPAPPAGLPGFWRAHDRAQIVPVAQLEVEYDHEHYRPLTPA